MEVYIHTILIVTLTLINSSPGVFNYAGVPLRFSDPVIPYCETVQAETSIVALLKSQNKHNPLYVKAMPLDEEFSAAVEECKINIRGDPQLRARLLADEFVRTSRMHKRFSVLVLIRRVLMFLLMPQRAYII